MKLPIAIVLFAVSAAPVLAQTPRLGTIYSSDGKTYHGEISVYPGAKFRVVTARGDMTKNLGRSKAMAESYGKEFKLDLALIKEVSFIPRPAGWDGRRLASERMERAWDWESPTSSKKVYHGEPFPVREIQAIFTLNSGEKITGQLNAMGLYLREDGAFVQKKFILKSKQKGPPGSAMDDLVFIERLRFADEGKQWDAETKLAIKDFKVEAADEIRVLTRKSLTPVPVVRNPENPAEATVSLTMGEDLYMAIKKDGENKRYVPWPEGGDPAISALAEAYLIHHGDYFNEKKLLGVRREPGTGDVLTLVSLRRRIPPNTETETKEYFRLSIWRWRYNEEDEELLLISRGTFFRERLDKGDETPSVALSAQLWPQALNEENVLEIGTETKSK